MAVNNVVRHFYWLDADRAAKLIAICKKHGGTCMPLDERITIEVSFGSKRECGAAVMELISANITQAVTFTGEDPSDAQST